MHTQVNEPIVKAMKSLWLIVPLFALLIASFWFAGTTWTRLGDTVPFWGWFAIGGGVLFSLLIGGGLMALMFYSARHGYDDPDGRPH
jgi:hypothetical protein